METSLDAFSRLFWVSTKSGRFTASELSGNTAERTCDPPALVVEYFAFLVTANLAQLGNGTGCSSR